MYSCLDWQRTSSCQYLASTIGINITSATMNDVDTGSIISRNIGLNSSPTKLNGHMIGLTIATHRWKWDGSADSSSKRMSTYGSRTSSSTSFLMKFKSCFRVHNLKCGTSLVAVPTSVEVFENSTLIQLKLVCPKKSHVQWVQRYSTLNLARGGTRIE